jgi:cellobiose transport system permease protein
MRNRLAWWDIKGSPYLYVAPFFVVFAAFGLYPLAYTLFVATRDWTLGAQTSTPVGFANFTELMHDSEFWNSVGNTFGIFVLSTVPQLLLALFLAHLLNKVVRAKMLFRFGIIAPIVTSTAVIGLIFSQIYSKDYGLANYLLHIFGVSHPVDWKADKWSSWVAIATMVNWRWTGYNALIYLAAMQSVPRDLYEAAAIDGASPWRQLWRITVPMIRPVIIFTVVLSTIGGLQLFTEPMLFDQNVSAATGGSGGQWQTVAQLIYRVGWKNLNLGYAAAMSWALFLIIVIFAAINALVTNRLGGGRK